MSVEIGRQRGKEVGGEVGGLHVETWSTEVGGGGALEIWGRREEEEEEEKGEGEGEKEEGGEEEEVKY